MAEQKLEGERQDQPEDSDRNVNPTVRGADQRHREICDRQDYHREQQTARRQSGGRSDRRRQQLLPYPCVDNGQDNDSKPDAESLHQYADLHGGYLIPLRGNTEWLPSRYALRRDYESCDKKQCSGRATRRQDVSREFLIETQAITVWF